MIIDCLSDLHGYYPDMPGGDLLLIGGDLTKSGRLWEFKLFFEWLAKQRYEKKIVIGGNHDHALKGVSLKHFNEVFDTDATYLLDSGCEYRGLKIWGSPYTPKFGSWEFMKPSDELKAHWDLIPQNTDILLTHGPAHMILDATCRGALVGCPELRAAIGKKRPAIHIFGHIHESRGEWKGSYNAYNVAHVDENYIPHDDFLRLILGEDDGICEDPLSVEARWMVF